MTVKKENIINPLTNKKVQLVPIEKTSGVIKDTSEATMLTQTNRSYVVPVDELGNIVNPLTTEETAFFEKKLGIDLNPFLKENNFWTSPKSAIKIYKSSTKLSSAIVTLDLSNPYDYIFYKIALIHPRICNVWAERYNRAEYEFSLRDADVELSEELDYVEVKDQVDEFLLKNKNNRRELYNLTRLLGSDFPYTVTINSKLEFLYGKLRFLSQKRQGINKISKVLNMTDLEKNLKLIVVDALTSGVIIKKGSEYRNKQGELIAYGKEDLIKFLTAPENKDIKFEIEDTINKLLK